MQNQILLSRRRRRSCRIILPHVTPSPYDHAACGTTIITHINDTHRGGIKYYVVVCFGLLKSDVRRLVGGEWRGMRWLLAGEGANTMTRMIVATCHH